jgi:hypothetical protein
MPYGSGEPDADVILSDHFLLEIDGVSCQAFEFVQPPDTERAISEHRTGEDGDEIVTTPGRHLPQDFTFRKRLRIGGAADIQQLYDLEESKQKVDGAIVLRDATQLEQMRWTFFKGFIYKISPQNPLDANANDSPAEWEMTMRMQRVTVTS